MITHAILYGIALAGSCAIVTGTIFSPVKVDPTSVRLYKTGPRNNDFEYTILKRGPQDAQESPDSKERRSQMGSSFIRFGRSRYEGNLENADYTSGNEILDSGSPLSAPSASRIARGRSDVIIRFGRDELKNFRSTQPQRSSSDIKFLRYGSKSPLQALRSSNDLQQLALVCSNVLTSSDVNGNESRLYLTKLVRLCNSLGLDNDDNDETRRKNKIIEILEDASQAESVKHE